MKNNNCYKTHDTLTIEDLLNHAWQQAIKYRFDPVIGKIHEDYLEMVKKMEIQINRQHKNDHQYV